MNPGPVHAPDSAPCPIIGSGGSRRPARSLWNQVFTCGNYSLGEVAWSDYVRNEAPATAAASVHSV